MSTLVQSVMGEVIGEAEEIVPQEEVLVVSKVVGVVSVIDTGTVKDVGVDVEGGLVMGEVCPVVVLEEADVPEAVVEGPSVGPGGKEGVLPTDEVMDGDVPGDDAVLDVTVVVAGLLGMMMDSVGGEEGNTVVTGVDGFVGGLEGVWLVEDVGVVFSVEVEVEIGVSKVVADGVGVSVMMEVEGGLGESVMVVAVIG